MPFAQTASRPCSVLGDASMELRSLDLCTPELKRNLKRELKAPVTCCPNKSRHRAWLGSEWFGWALWDSCHVLALAPVP